VNQSERKRTRERASDWDCAECGATGCFGSKPTCFKCGAANPHAGAENPAKKRRLDDWECPNTECGASVFGSKAECYKCGTPRKGDPLLEEDDQKEEESEDSSSDDELGEDVKEEVLKILMEEGISKENALETLEANDYDFDATLVALNEAGLLNVSGGEDLDSEDDSMGETAKTADSDDQKEDEVEPATKILEETEPVAKIEEKATIEVVVETKADVDAFLEESSSEEESE